MTMTTTTKTTTMTADDARALIADVIALTEDRDEARAEVERLRRDCEVTADELAEERTRNISLEGQMERLRERAEKDEAALRVVALWLGGPHHPSQPSEVEDIARKVGDEVERLRAIIEGRTSPPTREELDVHCSAGGSFRVAFPSGDQCTVASEYERVFTVGDYIQSARWWAHDRTGRPCAWPTVTP